MMAFDGVETATEVLDYIALFARTASCLVSRIEEMKQLKK
jgi:hypothetical protein